MNVAATDFTDIHPTLKLTISIGVGAVKNCAGTLNELLIRVDKCLYAAKQAGRNKTIADK
jgi:diguanylate cyclase (GGDEF)-like protein